MPTVKEPSNPTPTAEIAETGATSSRLSTAALAVGLENHRAMLQEQARRLRVEHDLVTGLLRNGGTVPPIAEAKDVPGDIIVTGDIHHHIDQSKPQAANGDKAKLLKTIGLLAAGLAGGAGAAGTATYLATKPTTPAVQPVKDFELGLIPADKPEK